jgi:hypothetical protein
MLPSGIITFVSCVFHPIFASHLIMPEVVEIFRDFRNLQSLLTYHHALRSAARVPNPPLSLMNKKEQNWEAIGEIEDRLAKRMERLKTYLKDSQIEVWNQVFSHSHAHALRSSARMPNTTRLQLKKSKTVFHVAFFLVTFFCTNKRR